tara:strand:+ start:413 stop:673 length:261 start_codon:yes stop_codon:yes gene_type:complete
MFASIGWLEYPRRIIFANIKQITEYKNFLSRILNLVINNEIIPIEIIVKLTTLLIGKKKCNNKIVKPNIKYPAIIIKNKSLSFLWL